MYEKIMSTFNTEADYKEYLKGIKWSRTMVCPYCNSTRITKQKSPFLYHCNLCNSNFSLTTNTVMHNSKVELRKWLAAIHIFTFSDYISYRELSEKICVNKNTAYTILNKLYFLHSQYKMDIAKLIGLEFDNLEILSRILLIQFSKGRYNNGR